MIPTKHTIIYLKNSEIDKAKWDRCIDNSHNGLIYAYSYYLDALAKNWDAFIIDDYKAIMPLPWRKKFGIKYCYHPLFTQQLGVFTTVNFTGYPALFKQLNKFTKYGDFFFNYATKFAVPATERANYIIELNKGYANIHALYNGALIHNLKKANTLHLKYSDEKDAGLAIDLYKKYYKKRTPHVTEDDYKHYKELCKHLYQNNLAIIRKIANGENEILALTFLLFDKKRLYNILNIVTEKGKINNANHLLLDSVIKEFSGQNLILDLAGSEIPGVKFFYQKFGAVNQPYFFYHHNDLPFYLKFLRKVQLKIPS